MLDPSDKSLTPVERMAAEMLTEHHQDEADALLLLDCVFSRICAADPNTLTECARGLQEKVVEVLASWLPPDLVIVDLNPTE